MHLGISNFEGESEDFQSRRSLVVVNDYKIRKDLFLASENLLKKIRKLEQDHADFVRWDQLLYQDWFNLTFRAQLQEVEQLERRYRTLSTFQLHLKYISKTSQVSMAQAYLMLKDEEEQYQTGDESWKFVIDNLRQRRFENATKGSTGSRVAKMDSSSVAEAIINLSDVLQSDDSALSGLKRYARAIYHYLSDIDDKMMERHLSDVSAGYQLFKESFQIAMKCGDWELLARIWRTGGVIFQDKLLKPMPSHLKDFLLQTLAEHGSEETLSVSENREYESKLRSSYRKLARLLHPDAYQDNTTQFKNWAALKWLKVQQAYKAKDHVTLKKLEIMCCAELGHLNNLTSDEIYQCSLIFSDELEALKKNLRECRKNPAWKFSSRRRYDALTLRICREFKARTAPLKSQVSHLENFLKQLEEMSEASQSSMSF